MLNNTLNLNDITTEIEKLFPLSYQESYDNAGLQIYGGNQQITACLVCLDVTENVVDEAINKKCNLIVSHHPLIFGSGLKKITDTNFIGRIIIKCIKNGISVYSAHTNCDNIPKGTSQIMCNKLGIEYTKVLHPSENRLLKIAVYVPENQAQQVRQAMFDAGAGNIGNYDNCSFSYNGKGTFRALEGANPFVGNLKENHTENEIKIESICDFSQKNRILSAIKNIHPYEEPAIDIIKLENNDSFTGAGVIGTLPKPEKIIEFLNRVKNVFNCGAIKYTQILKPEIQTIALCPGSGSFLLKDAIAQKADVFISGDFTYHKFFDADNRILIIDIGHYESENGIKEVFYETIRKKFINFEVRISEINTNPINYL